ncbi:MAG: Fic family protein [Gammaproteobacteria bacterium]|nr:Fic family protein [Gammaproteobacteria bacterium]
MSETDREVREVFRNRVLPVPGYLAGYSYLIDELSLNTILPYQVHAIALNNSRQKTPECIVHPYQKLPKLGIYDNLLFALKYEGVNLLILKQVFLTTGPDEIQTAVDAQPTSAYARRLCYLFEWLTGDELSPPGELGGAYADVLDKKYQYPTATSLNVKRWRVRDNLPGSSDFCPLVYRTQRLDSYLKADLPGQAEQVVRDVPPDLLRRAAAFLLLNDSKASFEIEREKPSKDRAQRWAAIIGRAGETHLSASTLIDMQRDLIEDDRFVTLGLRTEGGFVGEHSPIGDPRPDHISARAEDLENLISGIVAFELYSAANNYDTVLSAASLAFGFVYVHPFEDGNGRLHRYLIHHVLSARSYFPGEVIAPISVAILADLVGYRHVLESVSRPMLTVVNWQPTERGNVEVLNETVDYYRYFDATLHAEFLFSCIERTIEKELPDELRFLSARDDFHRKAAFIVEMPERTLDLLFHMLRQNDGLFSRRMRKGEFRALSDEEVDELESVYAEAIGS